ncbi:MAG TPA: TnpV protein [Candidatus Fimicola cottocaccae]|nr:TnpV protein [Candidatus Fimicola cottocaccae]
MIEITYSMKGRYMIPNITSEKTETTFPGKYGRMRMDYLKNHRKTLFNILVLKGKIYSHIMEIDKTAIERLNQIMEELQKTQIPPNKMKNQREWIAHMNNLKSQAEEIILTELIYS